MGNPELLLLDEPSEGLAPLVVEHLQEQIGRAQGEGLTILLAEQNVRLLAGARRPRLHAREGHGALPGHDGRSSAPTSRCGRRTWRCSVRGPPGHGVASRPHTCKRSRMGMPVLPSGALPSARPAPRERATTIWIACTAAASYGAEPDDFLTIDVSDDPAFKIPIDVQARRSRSRSGPVGAVRDAWVRPVRPDLLTDERQIRRKPWIRRCRGRSTRSRPAIADRLAARRTHSRPSTTVASQTNTTDAVIDRSACRDPARTLYGVTVSDVALVAVPSAVVIVILPVTAPTGTVNLSCVGARRDRAGRHHKRPDLHRGRRRPDLQVEPAHRDHRRRPRPPRSTASRP